MYDPSYGQMQEMKLALVFGIFGFLLLALIVVLVARHRTSRLKVIDSALKSGAVDEATKRELLDTIRRPKGAR